MDVETVFWTDNNSKFNVPAGRLLCGIWLEEYVYHLI